jgi:hypothetical protein
MFNATGYPKTIIYSWRIPALALLVAATHWFVESLAQIGYARGITFLISFFVSPLIVSRIALHREIFWAAAVNFASITLSFTAYLVRDGWWISRDDLKALPVFLAFSIASGAVASGYYNSLAATVLGKAKISGAKIRHATVESLT